MNGAGAWGGVLSSTMKIASPKSAKSNTHFFYRDQKNGMCENPYKNTVSMVFVLSVRGVTSPAILF
jgi:hypothetical protein